MMWIALLSSFRSGQPNTPHRPGGSHNAEALRQLVAEKERQRAAQGSLALNEKPPKSE